MATKEPPGTQNQKMATKEYNQPGTQNFEMATKEWNKLGANVVQLPNHCLPNRVYFSNLVGWEPFLKCALPFQPMGKSTNDRRGRNACPIQHWIHWWERNYKEMETLDNNQVEDPRESKLWWKMMIMTVKMNRDRKENVPWGRSSKSGNLLRAGWMWNKRYLAFISKQDTVVDPQNPISKARSWNCAGHVSPEKFPISNQFPSGTARGIWSSVYFVSLSKHVLY